VAAASTLTTKASVVSRTQHQAGRRFNTALAESLGLEVNALPVIAAHGDWRQSHAAHCAGGTPPAVTPGSEIDVRVHVTAAPFWGPSVEGLQLARTWLDQPDGSSGRSRASARPDSTPSPATPATRSSASTSRAMPRSPVLISPGPTQSRHTTTSTIRAGSLCPSPPIRSRVGGVQIHGRSRSPRTGRPNRASASTESAASISPWQLCRSFSSSSFPLRRRGPSRATTIPLQ